MMFVPSNHRKDGLRWLVYRNCRQHSINKPGKTGINLALDMSYFILGLNSREVQYMCLANQYMLCQTVEHADLITVNLHPFTKFKTSS